MKTTVSVPDEIFYEAEHMAATSGMSRSELFVTALCAYLELWRQGRVVKQLNAVYGLKTQAVDSFLTRAAAMAGRRSEPS